MFTTRMNVFVVLCALLVSSSVLAFSVDHDVAAWHKYGANKAEAMALRKEFHLLREKHGRAYLVGDDEYETRFKTFVENKQRVHELNLASTSAFFDVKNQFFDMSAEEFKSKVLMTFTDGAENEAFTAPTPTPPIAPSCLAKGVTSAAAAAAAATKDASSAAPEKPLSALPERFDWRDATPPVVSPVKNQGQCGSCWAFSAVETIESQWALKNKKAPIELSPQQVVSCSHACSVVPPYGNVCNQGCQGGWPWAAYLSIEKRGGLDSDAVYPYTASDSQCGFKSSGVVPGTAPTNYTCLSSPTKGSASEAQMQAVLHQQGPLSIAADAVTWQFYVFGVITSSLCGSQKSLDHAIQITGWGKEKDMFGAEISYWNVRNSWGTSWGYSGYVKIEFGTNACGVANAVSLPHL